AVGKANDASTKVDELGTAALEISQVTETIADISDQTNLLALNATIEAARAGEAGKGFAVVATEIKDLANQTADATLEIKKRIEGIQTTTSGTVSHIRDVAGVINEIDEIVAGIATAVEQQAATTREISDNISNASMGIQDVNENVNQSSATAGTMSEEIMTVNASVDNISGSSASIQSNAAHLSGLADKLQEMVGRFKV
ncbi:MAG: methyl-accepting chemotaxis protein, partial [Desulfobacterales bacterium]|nr:methyl-accepting chemotaxis protein [Desulfobacterales bacterium]